MAKIASELKEQICQDIIDEKLTYKEANRQYGWSEHQIRKHVRYYRVWGPGCFHKKKNVHYSKAFKEQIVQEYLNGHGSQDEIDIRHHLPINTTLHWFSAFSKGNTLKDSPMSDQYLHEFESPYNEEKQKWIEETMAKLTTEEKIVLIEECESSTLSIKDFCREKNLKYTTFYQWLRKYRKEGVSGLKDGRGRKKDPESLSEIEELRRKVRSLEKQLEQQELIGELLKKKNEYNPYR